MTTGGLEGQVVAYNFWPTCYNCAHYYQCAEFQAQHPAFPREWPWGREGISHVDDKTIHVQRSWVGAVGIGHAHQNCQDYEVDERHLIAPTPQQQALITRRVRMRAIEAEIDRRQTRNPEDPELPGLEAEWDDLAGEVEVIGGEYANS